MKLSTEQIEVLIAYFRGQPVRAVYVFGSYARGDADRESDLDLIIECDFDAKRTFDVAACKRELRRALSLHIDAYQLHSMRKYTRASSERDRVLIYVANQV